MKKYIVKLSEDERVALHEVMSQGEGAARKQTHARILLKADSGEEGPNWTDRRISEALEVGTATIERVRQRYVEEGLESALTRQRSSAPRRRKLDGEQEARLIMLACSEPEEGLERWTLQMLAEKLVELQVVESITRETVRQVLKKTNSSRG
jgi:transposase